MKDQDLVYLGQAQNALAQITRVEDVKEVRDRAEALRVYARRSKEGIELQNQAAEVKLRAERRGGELLKEMKAQGARVNHGGDRKSKYRDDTLMDAPTLEDLGLTRVDASRWQHLADLPAETFERQIVDARRERYELTTKAMMDLYKQIRQADQRAARAKVYAARAERFADGAFNSGTVEIYNADARQMSAHIPTQSVDLVFTSPPYNQDIAYHVHDDDMTLIEYQDMLSLVLRECWTVMRAGARIGLVIPGGVGRDPWVPFSAVMQRLLCEVGFTLFGEVIWDKTQGVLAGITSWGSFRSAASPRFRDRTERIVWAYKESPRLEIPADCMLHDEKGAFTPFLESADKFMLLSTDMWVEPAESATRVGHPAPFPVALAQKAIDLFAYPGAVVLDPFGGSGSTVVAAKKQGCRAIMFDVDAGYCELARERAAEVI